MTFKDGLARLWSKLTSWKNIVYVFTLLCSGSVMLRALEKVGDKWIAITWLALVLVLALAFYASNILQHAIPLVKSWLERKK